MHIMFRELAQQMGQQTVRAVFPEDIDNCINLAIINKVKSILTSNVGVNFSDKTAKQNTNISPVNALRTLYSHSDVANIQGNGVEIDPYRVVINNNKVMVYTQFYVGYKGSDKLYSCRLIDNDRLIQTLHDFCSRASKTAPIVVMFADNVDTIVNVYTGKNKTKPNLLRYGYIKQPDKVVYSDTESERVDCNLPEYLHEEIVKDAIGIYLTSMGAISK